MANDPWRLAVIALAIMSMLLLGALVGMADRDSRLRFETRRVDALERALLECRGGE